MQQPFGFVRSLGIRAFCPDPTTCNSYFTLSAMPADLCMVKGSLQAARPAAAQVATPMPGPSGITSAYLYRPFFSCSKAQTVNVMVVRASIKSGNV